MYTDAEIIMKLKKGDEVAIQFIVEHYSHKLLRVALGICGDVQVAEEVVQDALLLVCRRVHSFEERAALGTWLYRITVNQAKNRMRGAWIRKIVVWDEGKMNLLRAQETNEPEIVAIRCETQQEVLTSLLQLPVKYRDVLVLYYLEDMTIAHISQILEQPEGTIKSKLARGREKLRAIIESKEVSS